MHRLYLSIVALLMAVVPASSAQAGDERIAPVTGSNWIVDFGEQRCRLLREFGDSERPTILMVDKLFPGQTVSITIAGPDVRLFTARTEVGLRFGPTSAEPVKVRSAAARFDDYGRALFLPSFAIGPPSTSHPSLDSAAGNSAFDVKGLPQFDLDYVKSIEWLEISRRSNSLVLELPQMGEALRLLDQCTQDFLTYWDLDLEGHKTMTRLAEPINIEEIARKIQKVYPMQAVMAGEQASVNMRIIVDADGSITECAINDISATRYIKSNACDVFGDRAMFAPAEDSSGNAMKSYFNVTILYVISDR